MYWRLESTSQIFVFGRIENQDEAFGINEGDRLATAVDEVTDGEDGIMSCSTVDSMQVKGRRLIGEGQCMRHDQKPRIKNLNLSSGPPTHPSECPYWPCRSRDNDLPVHPDHMQSPKNVPTRSLDLTADMEDLNSNLLNGTE